MNRRAAVKAFLLLFATIAIGVFLGHRGAAQSATFQRGEHVRIKAPTTPSDPRPSDVPLVVVAVPNDRIRLSASAVFVNDTAITGFSQDFVARVARSQERVPQTVPDGHYFVMGESRTNGDVSEYWGQHSVTSLERTR